MEKLIKEINEYMSQPRKGFTYLDNPINDDLLGEYLKNVAKHILGVEEGEQLRKEIMYNIHDKNRVILRDSKSRSLLIETNLVRGLYKPSSLPVILKEVYGDCADRQTRLKLQLWSIREIGYLMTFNKIFEEFDGNLTYESIYADLNETFSQLKWRWGD